MVVVNAQPVQEVHRAVHAHQGHQGLGRGGVQALLHGVAQGGGAGVAAAAVVLRPGVLAVGALPAGDGQGHVEHDAGWGRAQFQRGSIDGDGLDGGAHGHLHVGGTVEGLALSGHGTAAHNGLQLARAVVQHHRGALGLDDLVIGAVGVAGAVDLVRRIPQGGILGPVGHGVLHGGLNVRVDGQHHPVAAGTQLVLHGVAVGGGVLQLVQLQQDVHHLGNGVFHIMRIIVHAAGGGGIRLQHIGRGRIQGLLILLVGDELVLVHAAQDVVRAVVGDGDVIHTLLGAGVEVPPGIVVIGAVAGAGQHGALPQCQLRQGLAEVALRRRLHAVVVFAQPDGVQVTLQDLILGVTGLQLHGQIGLLNLALVALLGGQEGVLDQLLGDGGAALHAGGGQVGHEGAHNALDVHAAVGVEAGILHRHEGLLQILGHGGDGHHDAVLDALVLGDQVAAAVIDKGGLGLIVQGGQVEGGGGLHVALGHAGHRAQPRQAHHQHQQRQDAHHVHHNAQDKVGLAHRRLEDAAGTGLVLRQGHLVEGLLSPVAAFHIALFRGRVIPFLRGITGVRRVIHCLRGIIVLRGIIAFRRVVAFLRRVVDLLRGVCLLRRICLLRGIVFAALLPVFILRRIIAAAASCALEQGIASLT